MSAHGKDLVTAGKGKAPTGEKPVGALRILVAEHGTEPATAFRSG